MDKPSPPFDATTMKRRGEELWGDWEVWREMSILWEKSGAWRWVVRQTKESKPFFFAFATVCGVVPGLIGFCVMQLTNSSTPDLEARLRKNARPESLVCIYMYSLYSQISMFMLNYIIRLLATQPDLCFIIYTINYF